MNNQDLTVQEMLVAPMMVEAINQACLESLFKMLSEKHKEDVDRIGPMLLLENNEEIFEKDDFLNRFKKSGDLYADYLIDILENKMRALIDNVKQGKEAFKRFFIEETTKDLYEICFSGVDKKIRSVEEIFTVFNEKGDLSKDED